MLENLFRGLFDTVLVAVISVTDFLLCLGCSLVLGLVMAFAYMYRTRYTKSFVITLALLPAVVCVVIMMVYYFCIRFSCRAITLHKASI